MIVDAFYISYSSYKKTIWICTAPLSLDQGAIAMMDGFHGIHPSAPLQSHRRGFSDEIHIRAETHGSEAAQGKRNLQISERI